MSDVYPKLMPRHALFHVRVNIHQLASVPLVKGEFGVRWKFKKVKSRKEHKHEKAKRKGSDGHADTDDDDDPEHADEEHDASGDEASNHGHLAVPSVVISDGSSVSSTRPSSPNTYAQYDWMPHPHPHFNVSDHSTRSLSSSTSPDGFVPARGMTPYGKLQDHNVVWEQTLNVVVQMDVNRDTTDLLPNELKLVVMQVCTLCYLSILMPSHVHI